VGPSQDARHPGPATPARRRGVRPGRGGGRHRRGRAGPGSHRPTRAGPGGRHPGRLPDPRPEDGTMRTPAKRLTRMSRTRRRALVLAATLAAALVLQLVDANPAVPQGTSLTAMRAAELPALDPGDSLWERAPEVEVPLTAQNVTYPFGGGSLPAVRVRAMHDGESLLLR